MKVKELVARLQNFHDDMFVVVRTDLYDTDSIKEVNNVYEQYTKDLDGTYSQSSVVVIQ